MIAETISETEIVPEIVRFPPPRAARRRAGIGPLSGSRGSGPVRFRSEILAEAVDLVHPLVQDRHDADIAVGEPAPIDEMVLVAEDKAIDAELGRNRPRGDAMRGNPFEGREQASDVSICLFGPPAIPGEAVDGIQAQRCAA